MNHARYHLRNIPMSSGGGIRTHVTGLMRPGWNHLQSTPQSQRQDSNLRYRAYEARLKPPPVHSAKRIFAYKKTAWISFQISSAVMLSLTKVFCYRAIPHSFIRLPPDRIVFLGIIKHGELDIRLTYAAKRRIFISLIIVVLLIIISFSLPRGYLCALVSFRIIIYHRLCGLSFYLWYKSRTSFYVQRLRKDSNLRCLTAHFLSREAP